MLLGHLLFLLLIGNAPTDTGSGSKANPVGLTIPLYSTSQLVGGEWEGEGEGEEEGEGREGRDCVLCMRWSYTVHIHVAQVVEH